jgi:DNA repair exonuclease SbcCD ATPase subunit
VTSDDQHDPQTVHPPRGRDPAADVEALERELARMNAQLAEADGTLAELERQRAEVVGAAENVRRAMADLEQDLVQRREALATAEREQAERDLRDSVAERDAVALRLAKHLAPVLDDIAALDDARSDVAAAHARLRQLDGPKARRPVPPIPPEPPELADRWKWLITRAGAEFDQHLADQLLDAAARSPLGHAIEELPAHLRESARQRRRLLWNEARSGLGLADEPPGEATESE